MKRIPIAFILSTFFVVGTIAQTTTPQRPTTPASPPASPPTQRPTTPANPPATQTPPALPTPAAPKPAANVPFPADAKVAFVSMQTIVAESKLGKAGSAKMKDLHDKNQAALKVKADAITAHQQKMDQQRGVISESALQTMARQLESMQREAQSTQADLNAKEQELNDDLLRDFQEKVSPIIEAMRVEKGLWVIFAVQDTESPGMITIASANEGLNLSMEIVKRLDAKTNPGGN